MYFTFFNSYILFGILPAFQIEFRLRRGSSGRGQSSARENKNENPHLLRIGGLILFSGGSAI